MYHFNVSILLSLKARKALNLVGDCRGEICFMYSDYIIIGC